MVPTPFGPVKLRPPDRLERRHAQVSFVTDPRVGQQDLQGRAVLVVGGFDASGPGLDLGAAYALILD